MRTPAAAIAWEFGRRHRWGLAGVLVAIITLAAIKIAVLTTGARFGDLTFALFVPIPLAATALYLLAVFTFGISGDLASRESMYPRRMLTLPVSTSALAGLPMLYGVVSMAVLWFAMRIALLFPATLDVPIYWPALFAASLLAWTQALTWMPYPFRGMRIVVSIALLVSIDVVVFTALENKASERTMLLLLAPCVPLAYGTALVAVRRARRGDVPAWRVSEQIVPSFAASAIRREFRSAARAQLWFEWRQYGRSLPLLVAIVLLPVLSLLFVFHETPPIVVEIVVGSLLVSPFMAIFVGAVAGKSSSNLAESYGITPFLATRPVGDAALVAAKWEGAVLSTLASWTIVAAAVPIALMWSNATQPIVDILRNVDNALGHPRAIILGVLVLTGLAASTWKLLVQGFYIAMSGRDWAVKGVVFATLALLTAASFAFAWIFESRQRIAVAWYAIPWVMAVLVALKLVLAIRVMQRGVERGLFNRTQIIVAASAWDVCVLAVYGILAFILPAILVRRYFLLMVAMLVVPFVRLMAAPLAVARNRHR